MEHKYPHIEADLLPKIALFFVEYNVYDCVGKCTHEYPLSY